MAPPEERPVFRPAEVVTKESALEAFESGDVERIRLALMDSSRCLDDSWVFPHAWRFVRHPDPKVRWAAVFALDQVRSELVRDCLTGEISKSDDSPALVLTGLATSDPDPLIREIAGATLLDLIGDLANRVREGTADDESAP